MQNILTLVMLSVLLFPSLASSEEVNWNDLVRREGLYYKKFSEMPFTGEITGQTRGHLKDGVKGGPWIRHWNNGQVHYKRSYKDGVEDGLFLMYWQSKHLRLEGFYKDGMENGPWVSYHENGQLHYKSSYNDGVKDGHWVAYWADGQLMYKGSYKNGVEDGPWVSYHENGQLIDSESGTFRNGVNID